MHLCTSFDRAAPRPVAHRRDGLMCVATETRHLDWPDVLVSWRGVSTGAGSSAGLTGGVVQVLQRKGMVTQPKIHTSFDRRSARYPQPSPSIRAPTGSLVQVLQIRPLFSTISLNPSTHRSPGAGSTTTPTRTALRCTACATSVALPAPSGCATASRTPLARTKSSRAWPMCAANDGADKQHRLGAGKQHRRALRPLAAPPRAVRLWRAQRVPEPGECAPQMIATGTTMQPTALPG